MNFAKFLRKIFFKEHRWWLLPFILISVILVFKLLPLNLFVKLAELAEPLKTDSKQEQITFDRGTRLERDITESL